MAQHGECKENNSHYLQDMIRPFQYSKINLNPSGQKNSLLEVQTRKTSGVTANVLPMPYRSRCSDGGGAAPIQC